jgi:hypothetical protein
MGRRGRASLLLVVLIFSGSTPSQAVALPGHVRADLNGRVIAVSDIPKYYCHNLANPIIHCYPTAAARDLAVATAAITQAKTPDVWDQQTYVELFDLSGYSGASIYLSGDYANLGVLGWNDRASSYIAGNNLRSGLYVNTSYTGDSLYVCCNQSASSLSSTFDNKISSARRL